MLFHRKRAFTLIELLVVVAIIAAIAGIAIPSVIRNFQRYQLRAKQIRQAAPSMVSVLKSGKQGRAARVLSSDVEVKIRTSPVVDGLSVRTRYVAHFQGTFRFERVDQDAEQVSLLFPFPPGMSEARAVRLMLAKGEGPASEPAGVQYDMRGIRWTGFSGTSEVLTAYVTYEAVGQARYTYDLLAGQRTGKVSFKVGFEPGTKVVIPQSALVPTERTEGAVVWRFENLLADRGIAVSFPAGASPLGRLISLFKLAALGVLLFGAGFWYLNEEREPGKLDDFRLGQFLLLALNYCLFFVTLGVMFYRFNLEISLGTAGAVSLPLLGLHTARVIDARFALSRGLPLVIYTFAIIVGMVFFEEHKPLIGLGAVIIAVAYLTITYRSWSAGRTVHEEVCASEKSKEHAIYKNERVSKELNDALESAAPLIRRAEHAVQICPSGFELEKTALDRSIRGLAFQVKEAKEELRKGPVGGADAVRKITNLLEERKDALEQRVEALKKSEAELTQSVLQNREQLWKRIDRMEREMQSASALSHEAAMGLDDQREETAGARALVVTALEALSSTLMEAEQLRAQAAGRPGERPGISPKELIARAGRAQSRIETLRNKLQAGLEALMRAQERLEEAERQEAEPCAHCSACGESMQQDQGFCGGCGTPKPHRLQCQGCGGSASFPVQVLKKKGLSQPLHCERCGGRFSAEQSS